MTRPSEARHAASSQLARSVSLHTRSTDGAPLMWVCAVSLWVPAALNLHFFRLLVRGALKQLSKGGDGEEKAAAAAAVSKEKDR